MLVAYSSQFGSTAQMAERIAQTLRAEGHETTTAAADEASDPASFGAVVLGSAVHGGHWLKGATAFLDRYREKLATRPLWLLSSGPVGDRAVAAPKPVPKEVASVRDSIDARDHRVFAGAFDRATADFSGLGFISPHGHMHTTITTKERSMAITTAREQRRRGTRGSTDRHEHECRERQQVAVVASGWLVGSASKRRCSRDSSS